MLSFKWEYDEWNLICLCDLLDVVVFPFHNDILMFYLSADTCKKSVYHLYVVATVYFFVIFNEVKNQLKTATIRRMKTLFADTFNFFGFLIHKTYFSYAYKKIEENCWRRSINEEIHCNLQFWAFTTTFRWEWFESSGGCVISLTFTWRQGFRHFWVPEWEMVNRFLFYFVLSIFQKFRYFGSRNTGETGLFPKSHIRELFELANVNNLSPEANLLLDEISTAVKSWWNYLRKRYPSTKVDEKVVERILRIFNEIVASRNRIRSGKVPRDELKQLRQVCPYYIFKLIGFCKFHIFYIF
jgi:hypothetical protein